MVVSLTDPLLRKDNGVYKENGTEVDTSQLERGIPQKDSKDDGVYKENGTEVDASQLERGISQKDSKKLSSQETVDASGKTSLWQTTMNLSNILIGMGLIALPATFEEGGWLSLGLLLVFAVICCYTGSLLGRCVTQNPGFKSYPDIAGAAYGSWGRNILMTLIFFDIASFMIGNTIALGDNLARIFPNAGLDLPSLGITLEPSQVLVTIAVMLALPTTWVRNMKSFSVISVGGVATSLVVIGTLAWAGLFNGVGFHHYPRLYSIRNLPIVSGIYAYCYAGHILIPNICSGMANPAQFHKALVTAFVIATTIYGTTAILGVTMFGEDTQSQITLNIPKHLTAATIALWTAVFTPLSKYGMAVAVTADQIDIFLPFPPHSRTYLTFSTVNRTLIVISILAIAIALPFFHDMLALCGAVFAMTMAVTLPAACYLKIFGRSLSRAEVGCSIFCIVVGIFFTILGTESSLRALIDRLSS